MKRFLVGSTLSWLLIASVQALEPLPTSVPVPADNPMTVDKIELGKSLYFDPRLSIDGTISCNSCHNVMTNGTDNRSVSVGVRGQHGGRSSPTVYNAAFLSSQFWDGRASTLEEQAKGPILNPIEMGMPSAQAVVDRLKGVPDYVSWFQHVFGGQGETAVTYTHVAQAIAAYERTLVTPNSPFVCYWYGDHQALSASAQRGMQKVTSLGCTSCHMGPNFSGPAGMPMGQGFFMKFPTFDQSKLALPYIQRYHLMDDKGRFSVTHQPGDLHMWRVPTWRNIALTAPYFHNGSVATLDEAVRVMAATQLNKTLSDAEVADIVAFLDSLTGVFPQQTMPRLPETPHHTVVGDAH
ncbi:MAG: c-type cytochrome [Pseudomonadales bacterium]|nr:c-type cytochrome [Pseudomonadales bacterium]